MITSRFPLGDVSFSAEYFSTLVGEATKQCYGVAAMAPRDLTDRVRCAVRGVLFKGWTDKSNTSAYDASSNHPPIAGSADRETMNADYFADFFGSGEAIKYVDILPDTRKVSKNGKVYYVSQMVSVNVSELRKKLERDGITKSLKTGW